MPFINSTKFGEVVIDGKKYNQVLIIGDLIIERDYERLKKLFNTSHKIGEWETNELLKEKSEIIVVGTGQNALLEIDKDFSNAMEDKDIEVISAPTPKAIQIYNEKVRAGKRVNALIHTTC